MNLVDEWAARLGTPTAPDAWLAARDPATADGVIRGRARDPRVALLQLAVAGDLLTGAYLELVTPMPLAALEDALGPGEEFYAADAPYPAMIWRRGGVTVAADLGRDGAVRLSVTGTR